MRCALWHGDAVLLVRHSYGDRGWLLPGGRLRRRETPAEGARREVDEEVGADVVGWDELGSIETTTLHKRDTTFYLRARLGADAGRLRVNGPEFSEVAWCAEGDLPSGASRDLVEAARRGFLARPQGGCPRSPATKRSTPTHSRYGRS